MSLNINPSSIEPSHDITPRIISPTRILEYRYCTELQERDYLLILWPQHPCSTMVWFSSISFELNSVVTWGYTKSGSPIKTLILSQVRTENALQSSIDVFYKQLPYWIDRWLCVPCNVCNEDAICYGDLSRLLDMMRFSMVVLSYYSVTVSDEYYERNSHHLMSL